MKLTTALYQLKSQPQMFLQHHLVSIAGTGVSQPHFYHFGFHLPTAMPPGGDHFKFDANLPSSVQKSGIDGMQRTRIHAHNVRMSANSEDFDVSNITAYVLDGTGPDLMLTGQLSNCIFAVRDLGGGSLAVAHIEPGGKRQTAAFLRQTIKLMGRFGGHGRVTHVFGKPDYSVRASVIGIRRGGGWEIYGQRLASSQGPIQGVTRIV